MSATTPSSIMCRHHHDWGTKTLLGEHLFSSGRAAAVESWWNPSPLLGSRPLIGGVCGTPCAVTVLANGLKDCLSPTNCSPEQYPTVIPHRVVVGVTALDPR